MRRITIFLTFCILSTFIFAPTLAQDAAVPWPTEGWQTTTPEAQGMNSEPLTAMLDMIADQDMNIHSVVVIRNGYLVLEAYHHPYTAETLHTVYSVTKSVTSALFGIAMDQGFIESVDEPMLDYFPDYTPANLDESKRAITLENVLTMSSGLDWPGGIMEPIMGDMVASEDWVQFVLDRPMDTEPGTFFLYNTGGSQLLSAIVEAATGQTLLDFARPNLFDPLGIESVNWWVDPQGHNTGGFGLRLLPRDMAKFGYLFLNNGQWDGQQIISPEWVATSTQKHIASRPLADGYGYQWWVHVRGYYMAMGYGGQYIIVDPEHHLVVVFTSNLTTSAFSQPESFFQNMILPAIESDEVLPENPEGTAALQAAVDRLGKPMPEAVAPLSETAARISGQEYQFEANGQGYDSLVLTFIEGESSAQLLLNGEDTYNIGLDNIARATTFSDNEVFSKGHWQRENRFVFSLESSADSATFTFTFEDDTLKMLVRYTNGSVDSFDGTAA